MSGRPPISPFKKIFDEATDKVNEAITVANSFSSHPILKPPQVYHVNFEEKKLGLTLQRGVFSGRPVVVSVEQNTLGAKHGIMNGDEIISIAGGMRSGFPTTPISIDSYDKFMKLFPKHNRPIIITFSRPPRGSKPSYIKQSLNPVDSTNQFKQLSISSPQKSIPCDLEEIELSTNNNLVNEHIDSSSLLVATAAAHAASVIQKNSNTSRSHSRSQVATTATSSSSSGGGGGGGGGVSSRGINGFDHENDDRYDSQQQQPIGFPNLKGKTPEEIKEEIREKALQAAELLKKQGKEFEEKINHVKNKFNFWIEKTKENIETGDWRSQFQSEENSRKGSYIEDEGEENDKDETIRRKRTIKNNHPHLQENGIGNSEIENERLKFHRLKEDSEEYEMQRIKEQSKRQWKNLTIEHLERFVVLNPKATYEDWLCELHPKMTSWKNEKGDPDGDLIDGHFYISSCDYLGLWNRVALAHKNVQATVSARKSDHFFTSNSTHEKATKMNLLNQVDDSNITSNSVSYFIDNNTKEFSYQDEPEYDMTLVDGDEIGGGDLSATSATAVELARQVSDALSLAFADDSGSDEEGDDSFM